MALSALLLAALAGPPAPSWAARAPAPSQDPSPIWADDWEEAQAMAKLQSRLILLFYLGERCPPCKRIEGGMLTDPRILSWMERHVIALRCFEDPEMDALYGVERYPAIVLLDPSLKEVDRITEYVEPPAMLIALVDLYEGRGGVTRAQRELEANPEDPDAHLLFARALRNRGRTAQAFEQYLWVFDRLRGDPAQEARRMGEILGEMIPLQRGSPEAARALQARRDAAASTLIEAYDPETPLEELLLCARELSELNNAVSNVNHTLYAWDTLRKREGFPREVVDALFVVTVQSTLITDKRFADFLEAVGDPLVVLDQALAELQAQRARMVEARAREAEILGVGNTIAHRASWYYEALFAVGRREEADAVVDMLLAIEGTPQAYVVMVGALSRSGRKQEAEALRATGVEKLPDSSEKRRFERVTKQLLAQPGR